MSPTLVWPQALLTHQETLQLAQQAPRYLFNNPKSYSSSPIASLLGTTETPETWIAYENLLLACLRAGDDKSAHEILERLATRFGGENERIMALKGVVAEAEAKTETDLEEILKDYLQILKADEGRSLNVPIAKRRIALARSIGRVDNAISYANELLKVIPTDAEAWAELADMYLSQGLYGQAIFALEEVLVLVPNAWNMYARLGEVLFMAVTAKGADQTLVTKYLAESVKRFCRSVELCDDYLRGFYGLKTVTDHIIENPVTGKPSKNDDGGVALQSPETIAQLNQMATAKLAEIVRRYGAGEKGWMGHRASEIAVAKELLEKTADKVVR